MKILQTRLSFSTKQLLTLAIASVLLASCVSSGNETIEPWKEQPQHSVSAQTAPSDLSVAAVESESLGAPELKGTGIPPVKVAILLPLSGQHKKLGDAMMNASQLALFDIGFDRFELLPKDTLGTPQGARSAAKSAIQDGAQLVLGPVFSSSVRAAKKVTESANINMVAFSTDWTLASNRTFLIGFLPFDQVERVISYASNAGYQRIGALTPPSNYGEAVLSAYRMNAHTYNIQTTSSAVMPKGNTGLTQVMRNFTRYDGRKDLPKSQQAQAIPFVAIFPLLGSAEARQIGSFLNHYDLPSRSVKRLGTGLMDDTILATDSSLNGAWFAAPSPKSRSKFERRYKKTFGENAPRIASLSYDATALATILARLGIEQNNRPAFDHNSISNPNGFAGVDGIFRFRPDGISERGLAVLEYRDGGIVIVDDAPRTFQNNNY